MESMDPGDRQIGFQILVSSPQDVTQRKLMYKVVMLKVKIKGESLEESLKTVPSTQ